MWKSVTPTATSKTMALNARQTIKDSDRFVPLNEEERSKLVRMRIYKLIFSLFFGLVTFAAVVFAFIDYLFAFIGLGWKDFQALLIMWTIPLGITLLLLNKYRKLSKDIKEGRKQIIVARIEEVGCDSYTPSKRRFKIAGSSIDFDPYPPSPTTYTHWVRFNGMKIIMPKDRGWGWGVKEGDLAELYIGPHSKRILSDLIKRTDSR